MHNCDSENFVNISWFCQSQPIDAVTSRVLNIDLAAVILPLLSSFQRNPPKVPLAMLGGTPLLILLNLHDFDCPPRAR